MTGIVSSNNNSRTSGIIKAAAGVPSNVVAYRASGESTPSGWSEYTTARGRMIVGLPSGGTDGGTVGTALTDAQDKSKSIAHSHAMGVSADGDRWRYVDGGEYGSSGTVATDYNLSFNAYGETRADNITSGMSANTTVVTSDILAYIQLMAIMKD